MKDRAVATTALVLGRACLYVALIVLCILLSPDEPVRFIYTGF